MGRAIGLVLLRMPAPGAPGLPVWRAALGRLEAAWTPAPAPGRFTETAAPGLSSLPRRGAPAYAPPEGRFERHLAGGALPGRVWHAWSPPDGPTAPPAILLLHGSNRDGRAMLDMWDDLAAREGLVLIAPDSADPRGWSWTADGPAWLDQVLAEAMEAHPFDRDRLYVYGHYAGANFALMLAAQGWPRPRAAAVHAGAVPSTAIRSHPRPIPLRIQIGDADAAFPLPEVRASAQALAAAGHDVDLSVIPGHDHWLYDIGPRLAEDAWAFLRPR